MRLFGLVLLIGGFLIRGLTNLSIVAWILMGLGALVIIIAYVTKRK
ncbi:MAG: hypothetical protein KAU46_03780 [Candidatus Aminicenantes bacterium]|nr:hypothetical protein [Candidatus Aminicenantes bacterium]